MSEIIEQTGKISKKIIKNLFFDILEYCVTFKNLLRI